MLGGEAAAGPSDEVTPEEAIKDPFISEFLDLKDEYSESDLEEAIILNLADFCLSWETTSHFWDASDDFASTVPR